MNLTFLHLSNNIFKHSTLSVILTLLSIKLLDNFHECELFRKPDACVTEIMPTYKYLSKFNHYHTLQLVCTERMNPLQGIIETHP